MNRREIKRICTERDNGLVTYDRIKSALKRLRQGFYSERICAPVRNYMRSRKFVLDYRELFSVFEKLSSKEDLTYRELCALPDHVAYSIASDMETMDEETLENALNSIRVVDLVNFEKLFRTASAAEKFLSSLKPELFSGCDKNTKSAIRRAVTDYAKKYRVTEGEAARGIVLPLDSKTPEILKKMYFLFAAFLAAAGLFAVSSVRGVGVLAVILLAVPISQTAKDIADKAFSHLCRNDCLPKLKLRSIPEEGRTLVVITTLLTGDKRDAKRFDDLEKYYLSNKDDRLVFGVLADLCESDRARDPGDEKTEAYALSRISYLTHKYGDRFALFIRGRSYDTGEGKFMGRERKRGAVGDLVRLIKRYPNDFTVIEANRLALHKTRYIITLDTDTDLYPGAVFDLVGAALHPSNKAIVEDGRVVSGYGVMQPRMDTSLESASSTLFSSMLCGSGGVDVYSGAAFDVYQNVFGEGIFCGKGIIDVEAYFAALDGFFPDGTVLSHDLLEGERMRCAALTDVVLCDSLPSNPVSYFKRAHRWARGDVQALAFAGKRFTDAKGRKTETGFNGLSRFKLIDNLRRLAVPIFSVAAILVSSSYRGAAAWACVAAAVSYIIFRFISSFPAGVRNIPIRFYSHVLATAGHVISNCAYDVSALFYSARTNLDALVRSLFRMFISHKKMLEWTVQETGDMMSVSSLPYYFIKMFPGLAVGLLMFIFSPGPLHKIIGLFWVAMPFASYLLSKKQSLPKELPEKKKKVIRGYAYRYWRFLSDYATPEDNRLPPDNVQYIRGEKTAHRTSPTNIGLFILSAVAARDMGFVSTGYMRTLLEQTVTTVELLEKWRGNLYNWYDTRTLEVIGGRFVSCVDSGNFAACLICAKEGVKDYVREDVGLVDLVYRLEDLISATDLGAFYDRDRELLSIGWDGEKGKLLQNCYDIYMTECRIAGYVGIGCGTVPRENWQAISRLLVSREGYMGMLSWNGTMFEYFMPALFLPVYRNSLEYESLKFAVRMQSECRYDGVWGKSECGYPSIDGDGNYKYKAVGVTRIGMERGLDETKVVAPYASFLAMAVSPRSAYENLERIKKLGGYGRYGFFESVDMSRPGMPKFTESYMSHHVGMSIIAAQNAVLGGISQRRFIRDPRMGSVTDLIKEKIPLDPKMVKTKRIFPGKSAEKRVPIERFSEI
ncbi:MAG: hypothetical protein IJR90_02905 [Clostridia bacterium]|nr:hypothetical protein [Clostridia bacterium]